MQIRRGRAIEPEQSRQQGAGCTAGERGGPGGTPRRKPGFIKSLDETEDVIFSQVTTKLTHHTTTYTHPTTMGWSSAIHNANVAVAKSFVGRYFRLEGSGHVSVDSA